MGLACYEKKITVSNKITKDQKTYVDSQSPSGKITLLYDEDFDAPTYGVDFDGFIKSYVRTWKKKGF